VDAPAGRDARWKVSPVADPAGEVVGAPLQAARSAATIPAMALARRVRPADLARLAA
jgi:hypothetical protein